MAAVSGCLSNSLLKPKGDRLRYLLQLRKPLSGVSSILYYGMRLALSTRAWFGFRKLPFSMISESEKLHLVVAKRRHGERAPVTIIPNHWKGNVTESDYESFCTLDDKKFVSKLADELGDPLLSACFDSLADVFLALEASLVGGFPQDHISILNGIVDVSMPTTIDLDGLDFPKSKRRSDRSKDNAVKKELIQLFLAQLGSGRRSERMSLKGTVRAIVGKIRTYPNDPRWKVMGALFQKSKPQREPPGHRFSTPPKKVKLDSLETQAGTIVKVWNHIQKVISSRDKNDPIVKLTKNERKILLLFYGVLSESEFPDEFIEKFKLERLTGVRDFHLRHPLVYQQYYGLQHAPPTTITDLVESAKRILRCFLFYSGRRAVCIALMTLGDLRHDMTFIRYTKTRGQINGWVPICYLWPEAELAHLRMFLSACAHLPASRQIMQVAELGWSLDEASAKGRPRKNLAYTKVNVDLAQQKMRRGLIRGRDISTHLGRINFATLWTLRLWAVQYPFLRQTPLYQKLSTHFWFGGEGLKKIARLVNGAFHHHKEIQRNIMGLSSTDQIFRTYNRGWPLEFAVWSDILNYLREKFARIDNFDVSVPAVVSLSPKNFMLQRLE